LFWGTRSIDLTNNPNDCLTLGLATLNRLAFSNLRRSDSDVFGTRQNGIVVITCVPSPASPRFVVVVMAASDDERTAVSLKNLVVSNF
jgi:hypothetical protein